MESLNHDTNWLKTITIEIDNFPIDREYINLFMQMYMQWIKDDGYTSSSWILIIPRLTCFDKLGFSQLQLYNEAQKMSQCFVCRYFKNNILMRGAVRKKKFKYMLSIHIGLRKWKKRNVFELHLKNMNPFDICVPCINITKSELLFEK